MTTASTKRQPVPRVPPVTTKSRSTAHLSGEFPFTEVPKSGPVTKSTNEHIKEKVTMANGTTKLKNLIVNNRDVIKRQLLVGLGAGVGLVVASTIAERLQRPRTVTNVVILEEPIEDPETESEPVGQ